MSDEIPPIDPDIADTPSDIDRDRLELRLLAAEAVLLEHGNREAGQRYVLRWLATGTGVGVILFMALGMAHMIHQVYGWEVIVMRPAFLVAMIVAPTASITTITVALFVGAFRKFEDKDAGRLEKGITSGVNFLKGS